MSRQTNFQIITHTRDIMCYVYRSLVGKGTRYEYHIPLYGDKPKGTPIVKIKDEEMVLIFINEPAPKPAPFAPRPFSPKLQ